MEAALGLSPGLGARSPLGACSRHGEGDQASVSPPLPISAPAPAGSPGIPRGTQTRLLAPLGVLICVLGAIETHLRAAWADGCFSSHGAPAARWGSSHREAGPRRPPAAGPCLLRGLTCAPNSPSRSQGREQEANRAGREAEAQGGHDAPHGQAGCSAVPSGLRTRCGF